MIDTRHRKNQKRGGFSLVEVLIAITIIAVMGGVVAYNLFPHLFQARQTRAEQDIEVLNNCVKIFSMREGRVPRDSEWPSFLFEGSKNHKDSYVDKNKFSDNEVTDPWGNPYVYKRLGSKEYEILSHGADGQPGGEEDDADISSKKSK